MLLTQDEARRIAANVAKLPDVGLRLVGLPRLILEIDISKPLPVVVADDKASKLFLDRPGRREAARFH